MNIMEGSDKSDGGILNMIFCYGCLIPKKEGQLFQIDSNHSSIQAIIYHSLLLGYCIISQPDKRILDLGDDILPGYPIPF